MAIEDYGDIQGSPWETSLDDPSSADGAAAQTIGADTTVVGVIGMSCSGRAGVSELISSAGMVLIPASKTSSLTSDLARTDADNQPVGYYPTPTTLAQGRAVAD